MIKKSFAIAFMALGVAFTSCSDSEEEGTSTSDLTLNLSGLEDLGAGYAYEGWIIVEKDGKDTPVSTGVFSVSASGALSKTSFSVDADDLSSAKKFVLSIEPVPDNDPAPAPTKYLVADFSGSTATVTTGTIGDFSNIKGQFILRTPTDDATNDTQNDAYGIWWLTPGEPKTKGLWLPELAAGWKYEGWVVVDGNPVSTGTFTNVEAADDASLFSTGGPMFPGEDFLSGTAGGQTLPLNLVGKTAVISVEPYPDNSPAPFRLKPLAVVIGEATAPTIQVMNNNTANTWPTGTVTR